MPTRVNQKQSDPIITNENERTKQKEPQTEPNPRAPGLKLYNFPFFFILFFWLSGFRIAGAVAQRIVLFHRGQSRQAVPRERRKEGRRRQTPTLLEDRQQHRPALPTPFPLPFRSHDSPQVLQQLYHQERHTTSPFPPLAVDPSRSPARTATAMSLVILF